MQNHAIGILEGLMMLAEIESQFGVVCVGPIRKRVQLSALFEDEPALPAGQ